MASNRDSRLPSEHHGDGSHSREHHVPRHFPKDLESRLASRPMKPPSQLTFDPETLKERMKKRKSSFHVPPVGLNPSTSLNHDSRAPKDPLLPSGLAKKSSSHEPDQTSRNTSTLDVVTNGLVHLSIHPCHVPMLKKIEKFTPRDRIDGAKKREALNLADSIKRRITELFADLLVYNSRTKKMFEEAKEITPKLRDAQESLKVTQEKLLQSEKLVAHTESISDGWKSKCNALLTSSENDRKTLVETKVSLDMSQRELEQVKKDLELRHAKYEADKVELAEDEFWKGYEEEKKVVIFYNKDLHLNLSFDPLSSSHVVQTPSAPTPNDFNPDDEMIEPMKDLEK